MANRPPASSLADFVDSLRANDAAAASPNATPTSGDHEHDDVETFARAYLRETARPTFRQRPISLLVRADAFARRAEFAERLVARIGLAVVEFDVPSLAVLDEDELAARLAPLRALRASVVVLHEIDRADRRILAALDAASARVLVIGCSGARRVPARVRKRFERAVELREEPRPRGGTLRAAAISPRRA